ncbi:MAG: hypothetical protein IPJ41_17040 [Phycisphaerales bacterium]|nr:hypothetical protein [Phycisphaerales bacterium]
MARFLQRDPNKTAWALVAATDMHGRGVDSLGVAFGLEGLYGDGSNLYEYLGTIPWNRSDPLGLSRDPFSIVDDYLTEDAGSKAAFLDKAIGYWHTAAYMAAYIASWSKFPLGVLIGDAAMDAMGEPDTALWLGFKAAEQEVAEFMYLIGGIRLAAIETAVSYADQFGSKSIGISLTGGLSHQGSQVVQAGGWPGMFGSPAVTPGNTFVYMGRANEMIVYVGQSRDVPRRAAQHGGKHGTISTVNKQGVHPLQASAIETAVIEEGRARGVPMHNKIRSITPRKAWFGLAMSWARNWMSSNPIKR